MKSARAEQLRLILPLLLRLATVDFFGTDDFVVLVDDDREEWEDDSPHLCAITCNGYARAITARAIAARATPVRPSMYKPSCRARIIDAFRTMRQGKLGRSDWLWSSDYRASCTCTVYRLERSRLRRRTLRVSSLKQLPLSA